MGKTLPVVWAEEAVRDAVRRVARALQTVDKDALLLGKLGVTTQDLWCLVDAGRATLEQTEAVSSAVASAHLSGVDLPADWVDTLGKVASGEVTADDAVQAVVESSLRDMIEAALCGGGEEQYDVHVTHAGIAETVMAVVAPMLAAKDAALRWEQTSKQQYVEERDEALDDVERLRSALSKALADLVVRRQALANVLGVTDAGGASGYYRMIQDVADLRAELAAVKSKRMWRTAPISGVMHLVPDGDGRRESVCGLVGSTTWQPAVDGNARCLECERWQPDTEATEQAPREPRVWRKGDRVVCAPDTEKRYPGTITGFNDYGQPLVKWDHWHKIDAYARDQLTEVIEDGAS